MELFFMFFVVVLIMTGTMGVVRCQKANPHYCKSDLSKLIENTITKGPKTRWGIHAIGLNGNNWEELYNKDAGLFFTPASNNKLLTCSAAYLHFGIDYTFKTHLTQEGNVHCLKVAGQFDLTTSQLIELMKKNNVNNLIVDTTSFFGKNTPEFIGGWEWGDLPYYYSALPTASHLDNNLISMTVSYTDGNISVEFPHSVVGIPIDTTNVVYDPAVENGKIETAFKLGFRELFLSGVIGKNPVETYSTVIQPDEMLKQVLESEVTTVNMGHCDKNGKVVDTITSARLVNLMNHTLLVSDNTWTELFLRHLGSEQLQQENAHASGLAAIRSILGHKGVPTDLFYQSDGSGLARQNRISPQSLTTLLQLMPSAFSTLLPVAGRTGTLSHRFTKYPGIIIAKTGTLTGVVTLSGYAQNTNYDSVVFSIMSNNAVASSATIRETMDDIALFFAFLDPQC